ncbi:phosphonate ABC transporter, permease protein PhnE, partial [Enterobacter intestinihominis]
MQNITLPPPKRSWFWLISWAVLLAVVVLSWKGAEMDTQLLLMDTGNNATIPADLLPPEIIQLDDNHQSLKK